MNRITQIIDIIIGDSRAPDSLYLYVCCPVLQLVGYLSAIGKCQKLFGYQIYPKLTANGKGMAEKYLDDKNRRNTYYYMGVVIEGERNNSTNIGYQSQSSILMYYSDIFISHSLIACRNTPKVNYINWEKTWHSNPVSHSPIKPKKHNSIIIEILYRKMFSFSFGLKFKKFETKSGINFFWIKG